MEKRYLDNKKVHRNIIFPNNGQKIGRGMLNMAFKTTNTSIYPKRNSCQLLQIIDSIVT